MTESIAKKRTVVIMDGSHKGLVDMVIEHMDYLTKPLFVKASCRQLDSKHPTMLVTETMMDDKTFEELQHILELRWPGLCIYNPPME